MDYAHRTHGQCAQLMDISRTTVSEIYESARAKIADCLVNGKQLVIAGGHYRMCGGAGEGSCGSCWRTACSDSMETLSVKGVHTMRVAVAYENGEIFQHFGHTEQFKVYDIEDGAIKKEEIVDTNGQGHGALAEFLRRCSADAVICGGIGGGAQMALAEAGIRLYGGVSGGADEAVRALVAGNLAYDPDVRCDHHDHEGGEHHCHGGHHCHGHGEGGSCH
jgi:predicted Fe-Mo cluster-binding NifX family protein